MPVHCVIIDNHGRRQRRAGRGRGPPWNFIHGIYIVDRGLIVLFFAFFSFAIFRSFFRYPPRRTIFRSFLLCSVFFPLLPSPLEIFLPTPLSTTTKPSVPFEGGTWDRKLYVIGCLFLCYAAAVRRGTKPNLCLVEHRTVQRQYVGGLV